MVGVGVDGLTANVIVGQYFQGLGYSDISPLISTPSSVVLGLFGAVQFTMDVLLEVGYEKLPPFGKLLENVAIFQFT